MGISRIEQLIEDIYEFVESCKMQPLSSTKVVVPKDELYDLLDELRLRTPDEIKRYQKIISNRDAIIADAEEKAATMLAQTQEQTNYLINEHEIMQQAYYQANQVIEQANEEAHRIINAANQDAHQIRMGALSYSEDMLGVVEGILQNTFDSTKGRFNNLLECMEQNLSIVKDNRKELTDQLSGINEVEQQVATTDQLEELEYSYEEELEELE